MATTVGQNSVVPERASLYFNQLTLEFQNVLGQIRLAPPIQEQTSGNFLPNCAVPYVSAIFAMTATLALRRYPVLASPQSLFPPQTYFNVSLGGLIIILGIFILTQTRFGHQAMKTASYDAYDGDEYSIYTDSTPKKGAIGQNIKSLIMAPFSETEFPKNEGRLALLDPSAIIKKIGERRKKDNFSIVHQPQFTDVPSLSCPVICGVINAVFKKALPSELFVYLGRGTTSKYLTTGKETALKDDVLKEPQRSVSPEDLFLMSLRLNSGDIFRALLTAENILTEDRARDYRNDTELSKKLKYAAGPDNEQGDNIGVYYHFFGTALISYARGDSWVGTAATYFDEIPSFFMEPIDLHETYAGKAGALFGKKLRYLSAS